MHTLQGMEVVLQRLRALQPPMRLGGDSAGFQVVPHGIPPTDLHEDWLRMRLQRLAGPQPELEGQQTPTDTAPECVATTSEDVAGTEQPGEVQVAPSEDIEGLTKQLFTDSYAAYIQTPVQ